MHKHPSDLLSALDSLCLYRIEDWWTYELCYKKHVRQFHKVSALSLLHLSSQGSTHKRLQVSASCSLEQQA